MKTYMLKGHDRAIASVTFNRDGDLLFSTSRGSEINVWFTVDGVRLGTYHGHMGSVWSVHPSYDSKRLLSGSADNSVKLWELETGKELYNWQHRVPVRWVEHAEGERRFLAVTDNVMGRKAGIAIHKLDRDLSQLTKDPVAFFEAESGEFKIIGAHWGPLNEAIYSCDEGGYVTVWDAKTGKIVHEIADHNGAIRHLQFSADYGCFLTSSSDHSARLYDTRTFKCIKVYKTGRPVNDACFHPTMPHVALAGGQSAREVTQTSNDPMQFATRIHHKILEDELACVPGHFGPVNAMAYSPDGSVLATGGEDGYVRLNILDDDYNKGLSDKIYFKRKDSRI